MECMVALYCRQRHDAESAPCDDCGSFLAYARKRLEKCPYGEEKPTCARCPIHCYKAAPRALARDIMRTAGPRMLWRHPWRTLGHMLDKLRKVPDPMELRRQRRSSARR